MPQLQDKLRGTGVAIVSPFTQSGAFDFDAFERILNHTITNGVEYIVLMGTTGESVTISKQEKKAIIDFAIEKINQRVPLVLGIGGNNTSDVVLSVHGTPFKGIDAILSVCPYYNKPSQEGIFQHFKMISEASPVPVILYTVPGRTSSNIAAKTTLRLATECKNIIGIKEASANFDQIAAVIKNRPTDFLVISGDDGLTLPLLAIGADGVISVAANAYPKEFSDMVRLSLKSDFVAAREIHYKLLEFMNALFLEGSPAGIKAAMEIRQLCRNCLRLPLVPVSSETYSLLEKLIKEIH
jgi:4-hydroxy-tetrahydrodipicolinate synthase